MSSYSIGNISTELTNIGYTNEYLPNYFPNPRNLSSRFWNLENSNPYFQSLDLDSLIKSRLTASTTSSISTQDFGELCNLTSFNHYFDGFNYFKCFLKSLLNHDYKIATHLLYYAELRWLKSLLSSQGIINFNKLYLVSTSTGFKDISAHLKGTSHQKSWDLFSAWAQLNCSDTLLSNTFSFYSIPYDNWLKAGCAPSSSHVLTTWVSSLEPKLQFLNDKDFRNQVSYRAHEDFSMFEDPNLSLSIKFILDDIHQILSIEENTDLFQFIDSEIFFMSVFSQFSHISEEEDRNTAISSFFQTACQNLGKSSELAQQLSQKAFHSDNLFYKLRSLVSVTDLNSIKYMFYRAILLMRIACSSLRMNISKSTKDLSDFRGWFRSKLTNSPWIDADTESEILNYSIELEDFKTEEDALFASLPNSLWQLSPNNYSKLLKLSDLEIAASWSFS
ncbi:hypothetical protein [Acinetobacter oleivorans]|uniref:hypothetical protein n=3 Tax=Acinetobacter oleivorans TaxID=1148157 RepID=UPI00123179EA|nr:hypothetical protein [Acinetobacter oleivorans]